MKIDKSVIAEIARTAGGHPKPRWSYQPASVSLLFFEKETTHFLAILKADREGYTWRNQVALPGGRIDDRDTDSLQTAIRELEEELAISRENVDYAGSLGYFQTLQNTVIEVFVGFWNRKDVIRYDTNEIARVLEIPLQTMIQTHLSKKLNGRQPAMEELFYPFQDLVIWGVTAKILHYFIELLYPAMGTSALAEFQIKTPAKTNETGKEQNRA